MLDRIHKGQPRNYSFVFFNHSYKPHFDAKILWNFVCANEANKDDYLAAINEYGLCIQKTAKQKGHGYG